MCVHVYMSVCMCVYVCIMYVCACVYVCVYEFVYVCIMCVYMNVHVCICVYEYVCECVHVAHTYGEREERQRFILRTMGSGNCGGLASPQS